jgi:hypothetical protein
MGEKHSKLGIPVDITDKKTRERVRRMVTKEYIRIMESAEYQPPKKGIKRLSKLKQEE